MGGMVPNGMNRIGASLLLACFVGLLPAPGRALDLPVFDAHIHYSQPDWSSYSPRDILALFDKTGVRWAFVSSTPDDGTLRLYESAPDRIVARSCAPTARGRTWAPGRRTPPSSLTCGIA